MIPSVAMKSRAHALSSTLRSVLLAAVGLGLAAPLSGCSAPVTESRWVFAPEKPKTCDLALLQPTQAELSSTARFEILGQITIANGDPNNPFDKKYRDEIPPRACAMGGEAVAIAIPGPRQGGGPARREPRGTKITYTIVRAPQPVSAPAPKF